jgi:hypothetical protein
MTLVVPITPKKMDWALQAAEKLIQVANFTCLVSGHDFSRADNAKKMDWALAPEVCFSERFPPQSPFSGKLSKVAPNLPHQRPAAVRDHNNVHVCRKTALTPQGRTLPNLARRVEIIGKVRIRDHPASVPSEK